MAKVSKAKKQKSRKPVYHGVTEAEVKKTLKAVNAKVSRFAADLPEPKTTLEKVSVTKLLRFLECHRKYYWSDIRRLRPKSIYIPFFVGSMFHKAMELFYGKKKPKDILKQIDAEVRDYCKGFFIPPHQAEDVKESHAMVLGAINAYMQIFADEPYEVKLIASERMLGTQLKHTPVQFVGRIDMLSEDDKGNVWVDEHKFLSRISRDYMERLPLDLQAQCYPVLVQACLGCKVHGICYNVCQKSALRLRKNERHNEFTGRIAAQYTERPEELFYREALPFKQTDVNAAMADVEAITEEIWMYYDAMSAEELILKESWYRNSGSCFKWGKPCEYFRLCRYGETPQHLSLFQGRIQEEEDEITWSDGY